MLVYDSSGGLLVFSCYSEQSDRYITGAAVFPCERLTGPPQSPCTGLGLESLARFWQASTCSVPMIVLGWAPTSTLFVAFVLFIFSAFAVRKNGAIEYTWRNVSWLDKLRFSASVWYVASFSSLSPCTIFFL